MGGESSSVLFDPDDVQKRSLFHEYVGRISSQRLGRSPQSTSGPEAAFWTLSVLTYPATPSSLRNLSETFPPPQTSSCSELIGMPYRLGGGYDGHIDCIQMVPRWRLASHADPDALILAQSW